VTSFIIISKDKQKREEYAKEYLKKLHIHIFDIIFIEKETLVKQNLQSIGIEEIKNLQKKILLKPIKSKTKAVILEDAQLLTIEAQNAMLKTLEEPPKHTLILLTADSRGSLLPTIVSRCHVIELEDEERALSPKEVSEYNDFIENLPKLPIGERLKRAESLAKDREESLVWLEKLIAVLREKMLENVMLSGKTVDHLKKYNYITLLVSFQQLHTLLKTTNVNRRFAWENTLLSIS